MTGIAQTAEVRWGYSMADLDRLAWAVLKRARNGAYLIDLEERHGIAWHGIVEALYSSEDYPPYCDLMIAGLKALDYAVSKEQSHHGRRREGGEAPKFGQYWRPIRQTPTDGFTDHLVEVLALPAALSVLTAEQYEAIVTLAAHDNDFAAAAAAAGMKYHGFYYRVLSARKKIKAVWFEGETPIQRGNPTDTCRVGHPRAQHGERRPDGTWTCRQCIRGYQRRWRSKNRQETRIASSPDRTTRQELASRA